MARPPLPPGLLEVYRDVTWVNPAGPGPAVDALLDWLDWHTTEAAALLPNLTASIKAGADERR
jgi:hypothetical protein